MHTSCAARRRCGQTLLKETHSMVESMLHKWQTSHTGELNPADKGCFVFKAILYLVSMHVMLHQCREHVLVLKQAAAHVVTLLEGLDCLSMYKLSSYVQEGVTKELEERISQAEIDLQRRKAESKQQLAKMQVNGPATCQPGAPNVGRKGNMMVSYIRSNTGCFYNFPCADRQRCSMCFMTCRRSSMQKPGGWRS